MQQRFQQGNIMANKLYCYLFKNGPNWLFVLPFLFLVSQATGNNFLSQQLAYSRVQAAQTNTDAYWQNIFAQKGLVYPPKNLFIRVLKAEKRLELWVNNETDGNTAQPYALLQNYPICKLSEPLGPKRKKGDSITTEGFYYINQFNAFSKYHLSLGINYPNNLDKLQKTAPSAGGDIMIHGSCASLGCMAMTDKKIEAIYWLAAQVHAQGNRIPVHIFPCRMSSFKTNILQNIYQNQPELLAFWQNLSAGYKYFETHHLLPKITIETETKQYVVAMPQ